MTTNRAAVETAIAAAGAKLGPTDQPLVELLRILADQVDAAGPDPSTRLSAAYLSALKDFRRALDSGSTNTAPTAVGNRLAQLRAIHGRTQPV